MPIKSLLPAHFSKQEHALDRIGGERLQTLGQQTDIDLWNPWQCPAEFLPHLAWAASVDLWNPNWPTNIKRRVIDEAPALHRIKGTKAAVIKALAALNIDATYKEWWQQIPQGERGTFIIEAYLRDNLDNTRDALLNAELTEALKRLLDAVKRGSQHYTLYTGIRHSADLAIAGTRAPSVTWHEINGEPRLPEVN
ncbi:Uncharacterised protein [BD1-7 clade bacterium]|uniref:Phage tail protein I n=1 Tax=BD1-7 clade bacterium TaxID=2029982 RepID=A0A5S9QVU4_9GAMM|nr:Uncharacterised protein [BD1-7 clade bacterium]CAA0122841.1 Uncharacterised protein [BD1-7 clade bacterium]